MKFKVSGQHTGDYIITASSKEDAFKAHIENETYYAIANNGQAYYGTIDDVISEPTLTEPTETAQKFNGTKF